MRRYLTKSRFKLGRQCPTKLYYTDKPEVYANTGFDDPFLKQLAIGGFQVGELARQYYPGSEHVLTKNYATAVDVTNALLERDKVTIFEAAFEHNNFFIRTDILVKDGDNIDLIEVKAKSCDWSDESGFRTAREKTITPEWLEHIEDVAFQKHVISLAKPQFDVHAHLMLADKTVVAATDGLNQKFRAAYDSTGSRYVEIRGEITPEDLSVNLLRVINVDGCCDDVFHADYNTLSFHSHVQWLADHYSRDEKAVTPPSVVCRDCEFRIKERDDSGLRCGFRECWSESLGWTDADFEDPTVLEIWDLKKKTDLINAGKIKMEQVTLADIDPNPKPAAKPGLTRPARRWLQIQRAVGRDQTVFFDREGIAREMTSWEYPLHFIDFETAMPVIPFKAGRRPYEGIAFQFSHHTVERDGSVAHAGQYLETTPGVFPNYDFVRELKRQLENDQGSIFRYHSHENSYLCTIRQQLLDDDGNIPDRQELVSFIESIAKPRDPKRHPGDDWVAGPRNMIDLFDLVLRYYYDPAMRDSNSIKKVLPATLNNSDFLRSKYSAPIYGAKGGIPSLNFRNHTWIVFDEADGGVESGSPPARGGVAPASGDEVVGAIRDPRSKIQNRVQDPYGLLNSVFDGIDLTPNDLNTLMSGIDDINDGGAAMAAYGKLQYEDMTGLERDRLNTALLKYCELDTLAMVMIYEAWRAEM